VSGYALRPARPGDYDAIARVVDDWWGRSVLGSLPRLFLDLFHDTSLVADGDRGELAGFLVGIVGPGEGYIHFVGVAPAYRRTGLARAMYEWFFTVAVQRDRRVVRAITSPVNEASIAFHRRMGFAVTGPVPAYNGPGHDLMVFERSLR
jgi:ribosomal protein S18 acetylase RimI-like enzyme